MPSKFNMQISQSEYASLTLEANHSITPNSCSLSVQETTYCTLCQHQCTLMVPPPLKHRLEATNRRWEHSRACIGSRWLWLEHKIAELNRHICQLDSIIHRRPTKERFLLAPAEPSPPCVCTLPNSTLLEHLQKSGGSLLAATGTQRGRVVNGFNHHSTCQHLPQLLLPDGMLNTKLQVC